MNIGTIGHVDHGKTTLDCCNHQSFANAGLAQAKAFADIDNAPEEKKVVSQLTHHMLSTRLKLVTMHT